MTYTYFTNWV